MSHVHKDLIIAWANGAEIQFEDEDGDWCGIDRPAWWVERNYRIKPEEKKYEKVVRWLWVFRQVGSNNWIVCQRFMSEFEANRAFNMKEEEVKKLLYTEQEFYDDIKPKA